MLPLTPSATKQGPLSKGLAGAGEGPVAGDFGGVLGLDDHVLERHFLRLIEVVQRARHCTSDMGSGGASGGGPSAPPPP